MRKPDLERNKLIYDLYFVDKLTVSQISERAALSISQVSRVLSKSPLYLPEKANRKEENRKRHNEKAKEIMKNKRAKKQFEEKLEMDRLHYQASIELSYTSPLSNIALRKNCSSAYSYNTQKGIYELKNDCVYSADMPLKIKC